MNLKSKDILKTLLDSQNIEFCDKYLNAFNEDISIFIQGLKIPSELELNEIVLNKISEINKILLDKNLYNKEFLNKNAKSIIQYKYELKEYSYKYESIKNNILVYLEKNNSNKIILNEIANEISYKKYTEFVSDLAFLIVENLNLLNNQELILKQALTSIETLIINNKNILYSINKIQNTTQLLNNLYY